MKRTFLSGLVVWVVMLLSIPVYGQQYDFVLKNGHVIDPANAIDGTMDVAIKDGRIAQVAENIDGGGSRTIDVSGHYITPGFIDIHTHVFYTDDPPWYRWVIADDLSFPAGVTTVVDCGSSGARTFGEFKKIIDASRVRTLAFLNIGETGMDESEQNPLQFNVPLAVETAEKYPDIIVGFKSAHYWTNDPYDEIHTPWASVDSTLACGRATDLPVMIDFSPRPATDEYPARSYRRLILEKLRPGDMHTHVFARHIPSLTPGGELNPDLVAAQERGVIFDLGHGAGSFVFRNAVPAIKQGFLPNSISTDLHGNNTNGPVINFTHVMSKLHCIGVPLVDLVRMSTINPARQIHRSELGTLSEGSIADLAVLEVQHGTFHYTDCGYEQNLNSGTKMKGDKKIVCKMTFSGGDIVYDPSGMAYDYWEDIPRDSEYWVNPSGQEW